MKLSWKKGKISLNSSPAIILNGAQNNKQRNEQKK